MGLKNEPASVPGAAVEGLAARGVADRLRGDHGARVGHSQLPIRLQRVAPVLPLQTLAAVRPRP